MLLLCSLPPSYKSFREILIYGRDKLSFEDVKGHFFSRDKLDNEFGLDSKADRREKCMTVSLKIDSFLDTGFEKLGHCLYKNQTGLVLIWQCTSRRLEVFQLLSTYSTQLIPYIVHD
ncbi:hypothetical protein Gotur_033759, partial [Gossypium turneri]